MEQVDEIKDLESVVLPYIGHTKKVIEYKTKRLTAPGENYGSLMLCIDIKIKNEEGNAEVLSAVAKMVPKSEFIKKAFKTPVTFKKEFELYRTVVPTLKKFQMEQGVHDLIDLFPQLYGGRYSLNPDSSEIDDDAIILMENLKATGYSSVDRTVGYDLVGAKLILEDLACFHAVPLAMKILKPQKFKEEILPHIKAIQLFSGFLQEQVRTKFLNDILKTARENEECIPYLSRLEKNILLGFENYKTFPNVEKYEPFSTLIHVDFWVNNAMTKFVDGKPVKNKFVDFQITEYGSPARDVIFFIFDSVQSTVVENHYNELIDTYFKKFLGVLETFQIDASHFTTVAFKEVINRTVEERTFLQCFTMLGPIFAPKESVVNLDEMREEHFMEDREFPIEHKRKLWFLIKEFVKRGWL